MNGLAKRIADTVLTKTGYGVVALIAALAALRLGLIPEEFRQEVLAAVGGAIILAFRAAIAKLQAELAVKPGVTVTMGSATTTEDRR